MLGHAATGSFKRAAFALVCAFDVAALAHPSARAEPPQVSLEAPPPPPSPSQPPSPAPAPVVKDVAYYEAKIRQLKADIRQAEEADNDLAVDALEAELELLEKVLQEERNQTMRRRDPGMMAVGVTLSIVGGLTLIGGVIGLGSTAFTSGEAADRRKTISYIVMGVGGVMLGAGIPLSIVGGMRVRKKPDDVKPSALLLVSPQGAALRVHL